MTWINAFGRNYYVCALAMLLLIALMMIVSRNDSDCCHALWITNILRAHWMHPKFMVGYCSFRRWDDDAFYQQQSKWAHWKKTGRSKLPIIQTWKMYCNSYFTCIVCICLWFNICNFMRSQRRFQSSWSLNILNGFGIPFVDTVTQYHWILFKMRVLAAAPSIYFMQFANTSLLCKLLVALARKQIA